MASTQPCANRYNAGSVRPLAGWQSGHAAACKAVYAGSIPTPASKMREKSPELSGLFLLVIPTQTGPELPWSGLGGNYLLFRGQALRSAVPLGAISSFRIRCATCLAVAADRPHVCHGPVVVRWIGMACVSCTQQIAARRFIAAGSAPAEIMSRSWALARISGARHSGRGGCLGQNAGLDHRLRPILAWMLRARRLRFPGTRSALNSVVPEAGGVPILCGEYGL